MIVDGSVNAPSRSASGKSGTPCERMQFANLRACCCCWPLLAEVATRPGRRWRQVRSAALNAGESGLAVPGEILTCTPLPEAETCGSG